MSRPTRQLLTAAFALLTLAGTGLPRAASAQSWLESLPGFERRSPQANQQRSDEERRARREANAQLDTADAELRRDDIPLISDVTLQAMESAAQAYRRIVANGGWPKITGTRTIRPGDDDPRVEPLRRLLWITGDYPEGSRGGYGYDKALEQAVRNFQIRHGIRQTGIVDRPTLAALEVPAERRLLQIQLNIARMRENLGKQQAERMVIVNVPAFALEAISRGVVDLRHRTIVGKPDRQTPTVTTTIRNVNFLPRWHVPDSVARLDLIPRLQKDPEYIRREHIRVVKHFGGPVVDDSALDWGSPDVLQYKFQQEPGEWNALGLVRIDMPNEHAVYMHDTPLKKLFGQRMRAFSAGCVRVEGVFDLVSWILQDVPNWTRQNVEEATRLGVQQDVPLPRPIPVHFVYMTAWAAPSGRVDFRPDLYGRDGGRESDDAYHGEGPVTPTLSP